MSASGVRVILARHGETEWNRQGIFQGRSDIPLNARGRTQARAMAKALKKEALSAIYSSPLARARETAQIIRKFHPAVPLVDEPDLVEMDLGDFDGMKARDWAGQFPEFRKIWSVRPAEVGMPGGESLRDVQRRAADAVNRLAERHASGEVLLVCSHNFVILSLRCLASGIPLNDFRKLKQDTGSYHELRWRKGLFQNEMAQPS